MPKRELMKGNEAMAEAAIRAGVEAYFGYPITPQSELLEYMSRRMPQLGRVFLQAESEIAAINMAYGAACTGARVMSSSSGPGVSLMSEGLSYIIGTEVPFVLVDVMRGGPGLGNIAPSQGDYRQVSHAGGHGDTFPIVLAPASVQEAVDLIYQAFDLAEKYRTVVIVLADGSIGQMMEPVALPEYRPLPEKRPDWAVTGEPGRPRRRLTSLYLHPEDEEVVNLRLLKRWRQVEANEVRYRTYYLDDAEYIVVGFGMAGRVALSAVRMAREEGLKVGLFRPVSLRPFPTKELRRLAPKAKAMMVVEMNSGQMLDDVLAAVQGQTPVRFYGRMGGMVPFPDEVLEQIRLLVKEPPTLDEDPRERWIAHMEQMLTPAS
ncbi:MAG: 3-methyl-2-oxobutanoate dehydrogenase subunit VorB [Chloroflexi bacterium]|nr:3-methyl-2-oxobutanoate dehydrogenase subunit VorB [Chloroflexota bacterium]